jgi:phospholipid-translocating ATPase
VYANDKVRSAAFVDNTITNTKYNLITFIPKNLLEQFRYIRGSMFYNHSLLKANHGGTFLLCTCRLAMNKYFLIIACLQLISEITPVNPLTTWIPLGELLHGSPTS